MMPVPFTSRALRACGVPLTALLLGLVSTPATAATTAGGAFGEHVAHCAQHHGFAGDHNPGMHNGASGWDPEHVC